MFETPSVMYQLGEISDVFGDDMDRAVSKLEGMIDQIGAREFTPPLSRVGDDVKKQNMIPLQLVTKKCYSCKCHMLIRSRKNTRKRCGMCGSAITTPYLKQELRRIPSVRHKPLIEEEKSKLNMEEINETEQNSPYAELKLSPKELMQNQLGIEVVDQFLMIFSALLGDGERKAIRRSQGLFPSPIDPLKYNEKEED